MKNITELKLTLTSTKVNPLRDKLREMSKDQLLAEREKAMKDYKSKANVVNTRYYFFVDNLCEAKGFIKHYTGRILV
jgi:hypothetical protein